MGDPWTSRTASACARPRARSHQSSSASGPFSRTSSRSTGPLTYSMASHAGSDSRSAQERGECPERTEDGNLTSEAVAGGRRVEKARPDHLHPPPPRPGACRRNDAHAPAPSLLSERPGTDGGGSCIDRGEPTGCRTHPPPARGPSRSPGKNLADRPSRDRPLRGDRVDGGCYWGGSRAGVSTTRRRAAAGQLRGARDTDNREDARRPRVS